MSAQYYTFTQTVYLPNGITMGNGDFMAFDATSFVALVYPGMVDKQVLRFNLGEINAMLAKGFIVSTAVVPAGLPGDLNFDDSAVIVEPIVRPVDPNVPAPGA
jgi:hypothetical protein